PRDRAGAIAVLRRAVALGVNHIDTAAFYFMPTRSANELISTALQPYPDDLVIATEVGAARTRDGAFEYGRPDQLRGQVEENIRKSTRLNSSHVKISYAVFCLKKKTPPV